MEPAVALTLQGVLEKMRLYAPLEGIHKNWIEIKERAILKVYATRDGVIHLRQRTMIWTCLKPVEGKKQKRAHRVQGQFRFRGLEVLCHCYIKLRVSKNLDRRQDRTV